MGKLSPFSVYVTLYAEASGMDASRFMRRFNTSHIKAFNIRVSNWKTSNHWTDEYVVALLYYCYMYNPQNVADKTAYGNLDNVGKCVGVFSRWLKTHAQAVSDKGVLATVFNLNVIPDEHIDSNSLTLAGIKELYAQDRG